MNLTPQKKKKVKPNLIITDRDRQFNQVPISTRILESDDGMMIEEEPSTSKIKQSTEKRVINTGQKY